MAIINQSNVLNLQPGITAPVVVHMSEGDVGTKLSFKLIDGVNAWTDPGNVVATVNGTRQDGTQFGPYACFISSDVVSFQTDAAMAGAAGSGIAEIVLTDGNGNSAGSANFAVMVERATFPHGVTYSNDASVYRAILAYAQSLPASLEEDINAKVNAEAAAREAADATMGSDIAALQSGLAGEISTRTTQDAVLSARMDEFAKLPDGSLSTAADAELADIRVKANGKTAATAGDAVREQITDLQTDVGYLGTVGMNLFDKSKALRGTLINLQGAEYANANFYCSDFIPVEPSTAYKIAIPVGSASAYLTCAYYDASKEFISGGFNGDAVTPENCAYIRINGSLSRIDDGQMVTLAIGLKRTSEYQLIINGYNEQGIKLVSAQEIFYNMATGMLVSDSKMTISTPDNAFDIGTAVNVGTAGGYLYWNKKTGALYTTATEAVSNDVYKIAILSGTKQFDPHKQYCTVDSAFPIFKLDLYHNKLIIDVKGQPAYLLYNGSYYAIAGGYHQELELATHCAIYYSPEDDNFATVSDFAQNSLSRGIPVMTRFYSNITCRVDYETIMYDDAYKRFVCYGDSLTWYNGRAFTWGPHKGETCIGFETYISNDLHARAVTNRGSSGQSTPQICSRILAATDLANFEVMTIMGGDNDDRLDVPVGIVLPVGSTFDATTVCGALQSAIEYALTQNPALRIILMTEPMGWTYQNGALDRVSELIPNAYRQVADQYGLPVVDLWDESGINELTRETYYADPAPSDNQLYMYHPNNDGWIRCSKVIVKRIKELI